MVSFALRLPRMSTLILILLALYAVVAACMWHYQRALLYHPQRGLDAPSAYGLPDFTDERLRAADGTEIQLWLHAPQAHAPVLVYFHGNGGNLAGRAELFRRFADYGWGVAGLSYRGYGLSAGSPTEDGLMQDARATLDYLQQQLGVAGERLILMGESLGSGVAVRMASERAIGALILKSPFTSITDRAAERYPWLPVGLLLKDRFDSMRYISLITAPTLILHGEKDTIVPVTDAQMLLKRIPPPVEAVFYPEAHHNDLDTPDTVRQVIRFVAQHTVREYP